MIKYHINIEQIISTLVREQKIESQMYQKRENLYKPQNNTWVKNTDIIKSFGSKYSSINISDIFGTQLTALIKKLYNFFQEVTLNDSHPSGIYSVMNALSFRDLILLAKIESLFPIFANTHDDININNEEEDKTKPYRDHFLHTSCTLHAGLELLKLECNDSTEVQKVFVYSKLFNLLLESTQNSNLFNKFPVDLYNELKQFDLDEQYTYIRDLWIVISLMHDIGYLPIIELHFNNIRETDLSNESIDRFINRLDIERKKQDISTFYENCGISFGSLHDNILPSLEYCATNSHGKLDLNKYISDPQKSHGVISGYSTLNTIVKDKKIFQNINTFEKFFSLIACSASISHVIKSFKIDDQSNWSLNPMGAFLKLIDISQEWLRLTWVFDNNETVKNIFDHNQLVHKKFSDFSSSKFGNIDGLTLFIGQSPIKSASFKIIDNKIHLMYHKIRRQGSLYVCEAENRHYDFLLMLYGKDGNGEKMTELPSALEILTGYECDKVNIKLL